MFKPAFSLVVPTMLMFAGTARAQDATAFTGPRAEATLGWDQLQFNLSDLGGNGRGRTTDLQWGGALGYDVALVPRLIGGIEASASFGDGSARRGGTVNGGYLHRRREVDVTARIGTPIGSSALLYAKAGYTNLQVRDERTIAGTTSGNISDLDGVLLAAGAEVKVTQRLYLKSEYRHADYSHDYDSNAIITGLGLRF